MCERQGESMSDGDDRSLTGRSFKTFRPPNLAKLVCEALTLDERVDASQIGVALDAASGDLTLFGTVPTQDQRRFAEDCAASIKGIHVVHNRLTVAVNASGKKPG
jgi:osmotically-inducible protein OsmY